MVIVQIRKLAEIQLNVFKNLLKLIEKFSITINCNTHTIIAAFNVLVWKII